MGLAGVVDADVPCVCSCWRAAECHHGDSLAKPGFVFNHGMHDQDQDIDRTLANLFRAALLGHFDFVPCLCSFPRNRPRLNEQSPSRKCNIDLLTGVVSSNVWLHCLRSVAVLDCLPTTVVPARSHRDFVFPRHSKGSCVSLSCSMTMVRKLHHIWCLLCFMSITSARSLALPTQPSRLEQPPTRPADAARRSFLAKIIACGATIPAIPVNTNAMDDEKRLLAAETLAGVESIDWNRILDKASKKALGGGRAGAAAAVVQVFSLMWLRTSMNYQYRYGGDLKSSLEALWRQGGLPRLYQGLPFALIQGPMTKFGDTAANVGILALLDSIPETADLPVPLKTFAGSTAAALWRIVLMPVDTSKTSMQVEGADGLQKLWGSVAESGPGPLYRGALATAGATVVGHFPWFLTYNNLNDALPSVSDDSDLFLSIARSAFLGLSASCVSDCASNWLRVVKTTKQTAQLQGSGQEGDKELSYTEVVSMIIEQDGVGGLFGRGLQTRLLTNALQGAVFSVLWKYFQQLQGMQ